MNKKVNFKIILFISILLIPINFCFAQIITGDTDTGLIDQTGAFHDSAGYEYVDESGVSEVMSSVIKAFLSLLGIIFIILIILGGYNWMTASGNEEKVTKAQDTIRRAIIGLIIVVAAYAITYFVFSNLPAAGGGGGTTAS